MPNPFYKQKVINTYIETVWNPLPYRYLKELRAIICPKPKGHFSNWVWMQQQSGQKRIDGNMSNSLGDWFRVSPKLIDKNDPDCVWRVREFNIFKGKKVPDTEIIHEVWSPVRAVALLIKLHLPLRTYQERMLDSGEADTWRYRNGGFILSDRHHFMLGTEKAPLQRGVFRRIYSPDTGEYHPGMYINTNKTADKNKDVLDRGYVIPWEHEVVLYWLEKLRDWQEKYNPIKKATPWLSLQNKHIGTPKSQRTLSQMGATCFLMRNASAIETDERNKPIPNSSLNVLWYRLLKRMEDKLFERNETLSNGKRLRLVKDYETGYPEYSKTATEFPLHSLRVALITHYAMDGQVPLPALSKLLAGHSRILMTLYYNKITPTVMREKMEIAEANIETKTQEQLKAFIADAELTQIENKTVFNDSSSIRSALVNRNPVGWEQRHIGLCLAGGNTVKYEEASTIAGCWNGGELITRTNTHSAVPHGPENCVRCRWFISDATYIDALRAHFNNLSYRAQIAANLAVENEQVSESLEDERFTMESEGTPFIKQTELQEAQRRYEKQLVDADEYAKDMRACFSLIHRILNIELERDEHDCKQKLVSVGSLHDIQHPISLLETHSELFQLSEICEDAEIYPDLADELRKTPAIKRRAEALNTALMREGYQPIFMMMDDKMQLIMGNAFMRRMAQQVCAKDWRIQGMQQVSGIIEAGHSLQQAGLLDDGLSALKQNWKQPIHLLKELIKPKIKGLDLVRNND